MDINSIPNNNENLIVCDNLVKIYKVADLEVVALQGLELTVKKGEMLGIVGSSGSGKSTLMNILGGLDRPTAGKVTVDGQDLLKLNDSEINEYRRRKVGFVWQQTGRNLVPYLTAQENVKVPMTMAWMSEKEKREWSTELLQAVDLFDRCHHKLAQLSGGEQQRVSIAVALANKPVLLLGDEPTGEVDSATAQKIITAFRNLREKFNLTIIIVTHDPRIAELVDRVVAIRDGKTSTETIRQVQQLEQAMIGEQSNAEKPVEQVTFHEYVVLDGAGRLQVPREYLETLNIGNRAFVDLEGDRIVIRPIEGQNTTGTNQASLDDQLAVLFSDGNQTSAEPPPVKKARWSRPKRKKGN